MVTFPAQFRKDKIEEKNQARLKIYGVCCDTTGRSPVAEAPNWSEPSKRGKERNIERFPFV
jgi:hypothetical protein